MNDNYTLNLSKRELFLLNRLLRKSTAYYKAAESVSEHTQYNKVLNRLQKETTDLGDKIKSLMAEVEANG